jgi:HlyD family secretion protein
VLVVPNAALRFKPSDDMMAELKRERAARRDSMKAAGGKAEEGGAPGGERRRPRMAAGPGGDPHGPASLKSAGGGHNGRGGRGKGPTILWVLKDGKPRPMPVTAGLSDGTSTQVTGEGLHEGLEVIAGMVSTGQEKGTNPFQPQGQQPMGPPRGGF